MEVNGVVAGLTGTVTFAVLDGIGLGIVAIGERNSPTIELRVGRVERRVSVVS